MENCKVDRDNLKKEILKYSKQTNELQIRLETEAKIKAELLTRAEEADIFSRG